jgi:uncharacterized protein (TIGR03083 family)
MTTASTTNAAARVAAIDRATARRLAATEYERVVDQLRAMPADGWTRPTDCPGWDVRAMAGHTLGMARMAASVRESVRQRKAAAAGVAAGATFIDALTAHQVALTAGLSPAELIAAMARTGPKAAAGRQRAPGFIRRRPMPTALPNGGPELWTMGFLFDVILTRDPWMHRTDIARAAGAPLTVTAEHDGVIVADVAREWAARHGRPCTLHLTGPAGGTFTFGSGGPDVEADAIDFCRALSGRGSLEPYFDTPVPF